MLKGSTVFELTNVKTGEVEVYEDHNMFTNALDSVFNRAPYYFNNLLLARQNNPSVESSLMTPVYEKALGGLLLFPNTIAEDANILYAPASNKPTGIASNDAYDGSDRRRGNFRSIDSGITEDGKGYRFVWEFPTSAANGTISCACLTSWKGGKGYLDGEDVLLHGSYPNTSAGKCGIIHANTTDDYAPNSDANPRGFYFGAADDGAYIFQYVTNTWGNITDHKIMRYKAPKNQLDLLNDSLVYESLFTLDRFGALCLAPNGDVWVAGSVSANSVTFDIYEKANNWAKTTRTIASTVPLGGMGFTSTFAIKGDFVYLWGNNGNSVVKINLSNPADITDIVLPAKKTNAFRMYACGDYIASNQFIIESDDTVHSVALAGNPMSLYGCWALTSQISDTSFTASMGATIFTPYLATINNLSNPVTKTPDKVLKVTYTVRME